MKKTIVFLLALFLLIPCIIGCQKNMTTDLVIFPYASRSITAKAGATFTSSDESIVTVDDSGLVLALAPGNATITVKDGNGKATYQVTVLDPAEYLNLYDCSSIVLKHSDIMDKLDKKKKDLLLLYATWNETENSAQTDDRVTIDYEGKVDGKSFSGSSATNYQMILGSGEFIDGFEEGLIGKKKGNEIILDLVFPDDYSEELAGKPVTFTVTVKKVETPTLHAFDNEFVQNYAGYENTNEFDRQEYTNIKATLAIAEMVEKSELLKDLPEALYDHYFDQYILRLQTILYYEYGTTVNSLKEVLDLLDMTEKELRNSAQSQLTGSVTQDCVFHAFAYQNKLLMSEEEFAKGTAVYITENGYKDLDDLLTSSGLALSDIREVVLIDYLGLKIADMVKVEK